MVLWAFVALVLVRGVGAILSSPQEKAAAPPARSARVAGFPDADARAFAVRFATAYLSFSPRQPKTYQRTVAGFLAEGLSDQTAAVLPSHGSGVRVAEAMVVREVSLGSSRALITVAANVTDGQPRYLTVPVARDGSGGLVVDDLPSLSAPPPRGTADGSEPTPLSDADAGPVKDVVARFLTAYVAGQGPSALAYFLAPGARLTQMPAGLSVVSVDQVARDTTSTSRAPGTGVVASVRVRDEASRVVYSLRYRLRVVRRDRWYVASVAGGPSA